MLRRRILVDFPEDARGCLAHRVRLVGFVLLKVSAEIESADVIVTIEDFAQRLFCVAGVILVAGWQADSWKSSTQKLVRINHQIAL